MANYDRGIYEPPSDDIRVFDGGEDDIDDEGSRLPLLIVIALLVLAAFAGVVWLAYTQGVQRGRSDAPRIIAASPGPDKTAPENGGGEANPYQGLKIYEQPAPPDEQVADDDTGTQQQAGTPDLRPQQTEATPQPATAPPRSLAKPAPEKTPAVPAVAPVTKTIAPVAKASPPPATAPTVQAAAGSMLLQIGSYKSQDEANTAWATFQKRHPIAGGYSPDVKQVDLGDKGTWYRLRMGPFDGKQAAQDFCGKLKADGASCFPAAP
jgi:cell division protein FtsN